MSLLSIIQSAAKALKVSSPSVVTTSTDKLVLELWESLNTVGYKVRTSYEWPQLIKRGSITLVGSQESYALPSDFYAFVDETLWDNTNNWQLVGPLTPQQWNLVKEGSIVSVGPRKRWRSKGVTSNQFFIDPIPSASEAGQVLSFEYISETWILPKTWTASTAFSAGAYCSYNGNIYSTTAGGTTGATPPTHTSGSVSDGGVTWSYSSASYKRFLADTDTPIFAEEMLSLGVQYKFLENNGMSYENRKTEYERALMIERTRFKGAQTVSLVGGRYPQFIDESNIPDGGYGG